ncbi:MAG: hypothetical protein WCL14_02650 [Bacteroidota bacterium]
MEFIFNDTPETVGPQLAFIKTITDADGPTGEMHAMMTNKGIVLADLIADCLTCAGYKITYNSNEGIGKGKVNDAKKLKKSVSKHARGIGQNGKSVLAEVSTLGDYGIDIEFGTTIKIPNKPLPLKNLMYAIKTKENSFTTPPCPLTPYLTLKGIVPNDDVATMALVITLRADAANLRQANKGITNTIAVEMEPAEIALREFANVIKEIYGEDPAAAAKYHFQTRNTSTVLKNQLTKILPTDFKTIAKIARLTKLYNNTTEDLWVRKGKKRTGSYLILKAKGELLIKHGYGTCTIENPSDKIPAEVSATINKKVKPA